MNPNDRFSRFKKVENMARTRTGNSSREQDNLFRGRSRDRNANFTRPSSFLEDEVVNAMLNARMIQSFGPEYAQFHDREARYSRYISQLENLGSHESLVLNIEYPLQPESDWLRQEIENAKLKKKAATKLDINSAIPKPVQPDPRFILPKMIQDEEKKSEKVTSRKDCITEWFEDGIQNELNKRRNFKVSKNIKDPALDSLRTSHNLTRVSRKEILMPIDKVDENEVKIKNEINETIDKFIKSNSDCDCLKVLETKNVTPKT